MSPASGVIQYGLLFIAAFVYGNFFEYVFHRWLMHCLQRYIGGPYSNHMLHHGIFRGDHRYHVQSADDRHFILFEWWQGPLMLACHGPVLWCAAAITGWPVLAAGLPALAVYYVLYEYLHWCMHNPANRRIEQSALFQYLGANHRLHHARWSINFNVVFPLADLVFGTLQGPPARADLVPAKASGGTGCAPRLEGLSPPPSGAHN